MSKQEETPRRRSGKTCDGDLCYYIREDDTMKTEIARQNAMSKQNRLVVGIDSYKMFRRVEKKILHRHIYDMVVAYMFRYLWGDKMYDLEDE